MAAMIDAVNVSFSDDALVIVSPIIFLSNALMDCVDPTRSPVEHCQHELAANSVDYL